jgi:hypothetical protein
MIRGLITREFIFAQVYLETGIDTFRLSPFHMARRRNRCSC